MKTSEIVKKIQDEMAKEDPDFVAVDALLEQAYIAAVKDEITIQVVEKFQQMTPKG